MSGRPTVIYSPCGRIEIVGRRGLWTAHVWRSGADHSSALPSTKTKREAVRQARRMRCR